MVTRWWEAAELPSWKGRRARLSIKLPSAQYHRLSTLILVDELTAVCQGNLNGLLTLLREFIALVNSIFVSQSLHHHPPLSTHHLSTTSDH